MPNPLWDLQFIVLGLLPHLTLDFRGQTWTEEGQTEDEGVCSLLKEMTEFIIHTPEDVILQVFKNLLTVYIVHFLIITSISSPKKRPVQNKLETEEALNSTIICLYQQLCLLPLMSFLQPEELPEKNLCPCDRGLFDGGCLFSQL